MDTCSCRRHGVIIFSLNNFLGLIYAALMCSLSFSLSLFLFSYTLDHVSGNGGGGGGERHEFNVPKTAKFDTHVAQFLLQKSYAFVLFLGNEKTRVVFVIDIKRHLSQSSGNSNLLMPFFRYFPTKYYKYSSYQFLIDLDLNKNW